MATTSRFGLIFCPSTAGRPLTLILPWVIHSSTFLREAIPCSESTFCILIPFSSGVTLLNFVTQTAAVIRVFALIQLLTNGGPNHGTTTMMYLIYQEGFTNGNFGPASALGIILFLFSVLLVLVQFRAIRRQDG